MFYIILGLFQVPVEIRLRDHPQRKCWLQRSVPFYQIRVARSLNISLFFYKRKRCYCYIVIRFNPWR
jgi:hypothetical protein